jgi:hypothetical protein
MNQCSSCAVFIGSIVDEDKDFVKNVDTCELPIEPAWVTLDDIVSQKATIDDCHVGLKNIVLNYFGRSNSI